jgi:hypothetical protein
MRIDLYTKIVLTLILLLLVVNTLRPFVQSQPVLAQENFSGVQFSGSSSFCFFDSQTGDLWMYHTDGGQPLHYKLTRPGGPLVKQ